MKYLLLLLLPFQLIAQSYPLENKDTLVISIKKYNAPPTGDIALRLPLTNIPVDKRTGWTSWHDWTAARGDASPNTGSEQGDLYWRSGLEARNWYSGTTFKVPDIFVSELKRAKANGVKLRFGIMTYNGGSVMPDFIWNAIGKWKNGTVPNWNDPIYLNWVADHCKKINEWIYANGYENQISAIDIRHYGQWGEWNMSGIFSSPTEAPAGMLLSAASGISIINAYIKGFPNFPLIIPIGAHDRQRLPNTWIPAAVSDYALTASNNAGRIGILRDHMLSGYDFLNQYMTGAVADQWKVAQLTGEVGGNGWQMSNLTEIPSYHINQLANGNGTAGGLNASQIQQITSAMGYRITVQGSIVGTTTALQVNLTFNSTGIVPIYEKTALVYDFGIAQVTSSWSPRLLMGTHNLIGSLKPPAGWSTLVLKFVTPGRPDIIIAKLK